MPGSILGITYKNCRSYSYSEYSYVGNSCGVQCSLHLHQVVHDFVFICNLIYLTCYIQLWDLWYDSTHQVHDTALIAWIHALRVLEQKPGFATHWIYSDELLMFCHRHFVHQRPRTPVHRTSSVLMHHHKELINRLEARYSLLLFFCHGYR